MIKCWENRSTTIFFLIFCDPKRKLKFRISNTHNNNKKTVRGEEKNEKNFAVQKFGRRKSVTVFDRNAKWYKYIAAKVASNRSYIEYQARHRLIMFVQLYRINHLFMRLFPIKYFVVPIISLLCRWKIEKLTKMRAIASICTIISEKDCSNLSLVFFFRFSTLNSRLSCVDHQITAYL